MLAYGKRENARVFGLQDSTIRKICKVEAAKKTNRGRFGGLKGSKHFRRNKKGVGKPLPYPIEIDQEILVWLLEMMDLHLPISLLALRKLNKSKIQSYWQEFKASRDWLQKICQRHGLALLQRCTSFSKKLPKQQEDNLSGFCDMYAKFLKIKNYPVALVGNMDETPVFFNMVPNKSFAKKSSK